MVAESRTKSGKLLISSDHHTQQHASYKYRTYDTCKMFSHTVAFDYDEKSAITPICNDSDSTVAAFKLLTALCNGCIENIRTLYDLLHNFFYTGTALCACTVCIYGLY